MQSFLAMAHPLHGEITAPMPGLSYYWSASQSEYATDVLSDQVQQLQKLYPQFLRHAISSFQSPDVLRFLGRKVPQSSGKAHAGLRILAKLCDLECQHCKDLKEGCRFFRLLRR